MQADRKTLHLSVLVLAAFAFVTDSASASSAQTKTEAVLQLLQTQGINLESVDYAAPEKNEEAQLLPIPTRIHEIIQPTLGFPALVQRDSILPIALQLNEKTRAALEKKFTIQVTLHAGTPPVPFRDLPEALRGTYVDAAALHAHKPSTGFPLFSLRNDEESSKMRFSVRLKTEKLKLFPKHLVLTARIPGNLPRHYNRVFALEVLVSGKNGVILHDVQDNAVGLTDSPEGRTFRFVHLADPQIGDEELKLTGPKEGRKHEDLFTQGTVLRQAAQELNFLKPDFALLGGDLVEGSNYRMGVTDLIMDHLSPPETVPLTESRYLDEYASIVQFLRLLKFPAFAAPGNHDGYAAYSSMTNPKDPGVSYSETWTGPEAKPAGPQKLLYDGFHFFRKMIGPRYFSFNYGPLHFVILDTYDMQRFFRLAYGFVAANSGGWISREQMDWLEADLELASLAGKKIVMIGHHDPRALAPLPDGGMAKRRPLRRALLPYDQELMFQYRNFQNDPLFFVQGWMSAESNLPENPFPDGQYDSASELLELIARFPVTHYLAGHLHLDQDETEILGGKPVRFVHTTAFAASPYSTADKIGHWGYRLFEVSPNGELRDRFSGSPDSSIEIGNLRLQSGYDEHYVGKAAGLLSASRPMPAWVPFSDFLKRMTSNRATPGLNAWSDPLITAWSLLDPSLWPITEPLSAKPYWERDESRILKRELGSRFGLVTQYFGTATNPRQNLFFNGNPETVDGVLEIPLDDGARSWTATKGQLLYASRPTQDGAFSLKLEESVPVSLKRISEGGRTFLQLPLSLPSGELGVGPYLFMGGN